ncbi:MAG: GH116 family glycosyl hydrolase [Gemmatimonadota bacterium]
MALAQLISPRPIWLGVAALACLSASTIVSPAHPVAAQSETEGDWVSQILVPRREIGPAEWIRLEGTSRPGEYLGAVGSEAAWLGFETGEGEVWVHPLKVAQNIQLSFSTPRYAQPIPGKNVAKRVEAGPGHVAVTYSHEGFVVRQHVVAPRDLPGILILLEVDAVVDLEIQVGFQPVLQLAWPGGFGGQYLFWDQGNRAFVLSESQRQKNAVIGSPWAVEASAHPAHRLAEAPSVFVIPVDLERAEDEFIPIGIVGGISPREEVLETYRELLSRAGHLPEEVMGEAREASRRTLTFDASWKPDRPIASDNPTSAQDQFRGSALVDPEAVVEWAKINLGEQRVCNPDLGCGLVAGWGPSGTSLRPGFGWFFGGDASINSLAMDATGQWDEVADGLRFMARYQRNDGKMPHEISQSAAYLPWFDDYPYAYYHADTTPYWIVALWQYWLASGDSELLGELWPAVERAYQWCLSVETDGDGIIENTTGGLGAIEVGGLGEGIHQDIYLAAVWVQAIHGVADMAGTLGEASLSDEARSLGARATATLNRRYWMPEEGHHAFGILQGGGTNGNLTAWPATALAFGLMDRQEAEGSLRALAGDAIATNWGARLLSTESGLYDPLHYNNGMVWPFMTGFVAWAQYEYRRPWNGFPLLEALWRLHGDWSLGRHPENLSGAFYQTLDATVPHQFFASSMLVTPLARGLLGWAPDAPRARTRLAPQPHPRWTGFSARNLRVGETSIEVRYRRNLQGVEVQLQSTGPEVEMTYVQAIPLGATEVRASASVDAALGRQQQGLHDIQQEMVFTLREEAPVRLSFQWVGGLEAYTEPQPTLSPGAMSGGIRILDFLRDGEDWVLSVEGEGGTQEAVRLLGAAVTVDDDGVEVRGETEEQSALLIRFPAGRPRVVKTIRLSPAVPNRQGPV